MNIFRLDYNPVLAARYHCDKHVNKMLLEAGQILNTALHETGHSEYAFYGATHSGHTTIEWVKESDGNFLWAMHLITALNYEKHYRYDSGNHTTYTKMLDAWFEDGTCILPLDFDEPTTDQPLAGGGYQSNAPDAVQRYRDYYSDVKAEKDWFTYEKGRPQPKWLSQ